MASTVGDTGALAAVITFPPRRAVTSPIAAVAVTSTIVGASQQSAVEASVTSIAAACEVGTYAIIRTVVGADALRAVLACVARIAAANRVFTETVV